MVEAKKSADKETERRSDNAIARSPRAIVLKFGCLAMQPPENNGDDDIDDIFNRLAEARKTFLANAAEQPNIRLLDVPPDDKIRTMLTGLPNDDGVTIAIQTPPIVFSIHYPKRLQAKFSWGQPGKNTSTPEDFIFVYDGTVFCWQPNARRMLLASTTLAPR